MLWENRSRKDKFGTTNHCLFFDKLRSRGQVRWLDYILARYYSSTQGRFTSPDEFKGGPQALWVLGSGDPEKQALVYADITNPQSLNLHLAHLTTWSRRGASVQVVTMIGQQAIELQR